jgi:hypothetical protein
LRRKKAKSGVASDAGHSVEGSTIVEGLKESRSGEIERGNIGEVKGESAGAEASKKKTMQSKKL